MSEPDSRSMISVVTIASMALATLVMAIWGFNNLTAPIAKDPATVSSGTDGSCSTSQPGSVLRRNQVTVSVFNAGKKHGRAQATLDLLERAHFVAGAVGNAAGAGVTRVQIRTTVQDDPAARLVALAFGKNTPVVVSTDDLGPGIDVIIGDKFKKLDAAAPTSVKVTAGSTCS